VEKNPFLSIFFRKMPVYEVFLIKLYLKQHGAQTSFALTGCSHHPHTRAHISRKKPKNDLTLESTQMLFWIHGKTLFYTRGFADTWDVQGYTSVL
jgi:hypothetical protein